MRSDLVTTIMVIAIGGNVHDTLKGHEQELPGIARPATIDLGHLPLVNLSGQADISIQNLPIRVLGRLVEHYAAFSVRRFATCPRISSAAIR